jgi:large subunit ribosomal protein L22e
LLSLHLNIANAQRQFVIDCSKPVNDKIYDLSAFEKFLHDRIKVDGRTGNLADAITISQVGGDKIELVSHGDFSGKYLKYLYGPPRQWQRRLIGDRRTKKYLKKQQLRDWLRIVSRSKGSYELRFFNVMNDGDDDDDE